MIVAAAIKDKNDRVWAVPAPGRHGDIIRRMYAHRIEQGLKHDDAFVGTDNGDTQGFIDDEHGFVDRKQAFRIADQCRQILDMEKTVPTTGLFSEDVW